MDQNFNYMAFAMMKMLNKSDNNSTNYILYVSIFFVTIIILLIFFILYDRQRTIIEYVSLYSNNINQLHNPYLQKYIQPVVKPIVETYDIVNKERRDIPPPMIGGRYAPTSVFIEQTRPSNWNVVPYQHNSNAPLSYF
jgi:hypothetical protein